MTRAGWRQVKIGMLSPLTRVGKTRAGVRQVNIGTRARWRQGRLESPHPLKPMSKAVVGGKNTRKARQFDRRRNMKMTGSTQKWCVCARACVSVCLCVCLEEIARQNQITYTLKQAVRKA
mmetsp:Transcript_68466/g.182637  ORF Transcript_68466/g.182637 Transcript_68466/m.182637 type:complete len:120 (-) Transcript_68466:286-645(-)|eukprot:CAMPEP_0113730596 /NCGR_PEP_ID=MMETSP0038_2-20120614/43244_1 /TAXON_ID=2898 /ORGANISM="Cryptomonas paramecium" /LENGTH=119 /DNA_ID=CAMNT_0000662669 /DNA_START=348 /DNA_END=707 /DNA_ORIENTATION=- /assembly_acc=CAM_ASM_000170